MNEPKELREANNSRSTVASFKVFDMSLNILQLEYNMFLDNAAKTTNRKLFDIGLFDRFENKNEKCQDCFTFSKIKQAARGQK